MTPDAREAALGALIPDDSYRSPQLPTLRFGRPALVTIFAPRTRQPAESTVAPTSWLATDADSGDFLVFARTIAHNPAPGFEPGPVPPYRGTMDPPAAYAQMRAHWPALSGAFFSGAPADAAAAAEFEAALHSAVPPRLWPWLRECCADFFDWLGAGA